MRPTVRLFVLLTLGAWVPSQLLAQASPIAEQPFRVNSEPRWFKGNLHTHSLWSDGNDYPEMIVDWYQRHGYQFLALSDHNTLSQGPRWMSVAAANKRAGQDGFALYKTRFTQDWVETRTEKNDLQVRLKPLGEFRHFFEQPGQFLLIQGEEITDAFETKPIHMNASNLLEQIRPQGGKSVSDTMTNNLMVVEDQAKKLGRPILTHLNHPNFGYGITAEELAMVTKERYFEVYNGHPDVHQQGDETHASVERMWDIINTIRIGEMKAAPVAGLATDDSHNYFGKNGSSPGRGWVCVRSRFLTPESIILAMQAGEFYASSGVTLKNVHFSSDSRTLEVVIDPEKAAKYTTRFIGTLKGYDPTRRAVQGKDGSPLAVTQRYSDDVGRVLATVEGTHASYQLTGKELYVRAVVTSSRPPENPSFPEQRSQAWTQPVGWETWMEVTRTRQQDSEDFTKVDPASLGIKPVIEREDPRTHFVVGGKNPNSRISTLTEINGRTISELEHDMRPGAQSEVGSDAGFLGVNEKLLEVLLVDNTFVTETSGLTHQDVAKHMHLLAAIGEKAGGKDFLYHGRRYRVKSSYSRGFQLSPFRDGTKTSIKVTVTHLGNGKEIEYSLLVPQMVERYGFYEGKGTPYRVDPAKLLEVFDFLKGK